MKNERLAQTLEKYKETVSKLNEYIAFEQGKQSGFMNHTKEYREALRTEIELQKEKLDILNKHADQIEDEIKN